MITVGLDFGTHQTKVCIERKEGLELNYTFMQFEDNYKQKHYTLPSILQQSADGKLSYGYIPSTDNGLIIRYFKQDTFTNNCSEKEHNIAIFRSIWYISFILFDLEEKFGQEFTIQMGVPTDGEHLNKQKQLAVSILASAYKLVEDVFENNKQKFLDTSILELLKLTDIISYSKEIKDEYGILVFPEAYACLMPLISSSKIANGMSLMVDIGGGTTDISFFTIQDGRPQVYDYYSINKGLNYLVEAEKRMNESRTDSNVHDSSEISKQRKGEYKGDINRVCVNLIGKLQSEFQKQCKLRPERLIDALKVRPIIYTGGGSTFSTLRTSYGGFKDVLHISHHEWRTKSISNINSIVSKGLCPILSTAYGLAISVSNDNIKCLPFRDVFESIRGYEEEHHKPKTKKSTFGSDYGDFNYTDDWDAWK